MDWYDFFFGFLSKYAVFSGRARRKEVVLAVASCIVSTIIITPLTSSVVWLGTAINYFMILPYLSLLVRRLHDTDRSGGWVLVYLIPCCGPLSLMYFILQRGTRGENRYGPDPKDVEP